MALTKVQLVDLNSNELILDLDADTSLHSDTDDQIDIKIGGADDFRFTANTFTALAGSGVVIPDGGLTLGSTAVTSTAAELNILDGVTSTATELNIIDGNATVGTTAFADGDGIVTNDNGTMRQTSATTLKTYMADVTLTTAAQTNITSLGTLTALTVDDVAIDGKVVTMTGSSGDTFVTTVAANGATSLVTTDTAAAAANLTITADGTVGINSTGDMTLDSSADIVLDAAGGDLNFKQAGTEILRISNTSTNAVLQNRVDSSDIIFKQADGTETLRLDDDTTVKVATDLTVGDDVSLVSDAAVLNFGADSDVVLTHVADTGLLLNTTMVVQFRDSAINIGSPADGDLDINADDEIELNSTLIDINGNVEISGTATTTGVHTFTAVPVFPNDTIETADIQADAITAAKIADNAVVTAGINADAVTGAKIADDAINSEHYTDGSIDTAHIADAQITTAKLSTAVFTGATDIGAAIVDADLFLMDDGAGGTIRKTTASRLKTYTAVASTPNFFVRRTSNVTIGSNNVSTKITFDEEDYDVGSAYNTSTGKFQPQVAGKYFILIQVRFADTNSSTDIANAVIYKNGSGIISNGVGFDSDYAPYIQTSGIVEMNGSSDYIEGYSYQRLSQIDITGNSGNATFMTGYRIIE